MALVDVKNQNIRQKLSVTAVTEKKTFVRKYSGSTAPFIMTGTILMQPKEGHSAEEILAKYQVDAEDVKKTDIGVVVRLKNWDMILPTANAIYESGLVDWCHPDFIAFVKTMTNDQFFRYQYYLDNWGQTGGTSGIDINVLNQAFA